MADPLSPRLSWQRGPIFKFFASLKLAVVLLAVLIIASIAGTIYESSFDAKVARAYIYRAPWFNLWLVLLGANLVVSALSRWPWRKHHVAFLITHLGIITLLTGSLIGRIWGIEGTMTLFKGDAPSNHLLVDEHQLRVHDSDGIIKGYRAEFLHRPPSPEHPRDFGMLAGGAHLSVIDYANAIDAKLNPQPIDADGTPALHFAIKTAMMGQNLESWLLADDAQYGSFAMGLAKIELRRGKANGVQNSSTRTSTSAEAEIEESIFVFAKSPQQIGHVAKGGGSSGAKILLAQSGSENKGRLTISLGNHKQVMDVAENLRRDVPIEGTNFAARIENYWPDFRIENGKPVSMSESPNNPAVVVIVHGHGVPVAEAEHATSSTASTPRIAPEMSAENAAQNHLTLFVDENGAVSYELRSRKLGQSSGLLEPNQPLVTGWADWQLVVDKVLPKAQRWMDFTPAASESKDMPDGVRVRVEQDGQRFEQWVPSGWQIAIPTAPQPISAAFGFRSIPLPITLELLNFEVARNEGSDAPAGFKSTVRVSTAEGETATGQCWMNHPYNFPGGWWRTWTGLTFKMSQASWNPENLEQSTIQILRDPGWSLKWIGSLLIVIGVFLMFYVKKFRRPLVRAATGTIPEPSRVEVIAA